MNRRPASSWLGKGLSFGAFYAGFKYAGILAAPAYGGLIGSLLVVGGVTCLSASAYEKLVHGNTGSFNDMIDTFHHETLQFLQSSFMLIPVLGQCCA